MSERTSDGLDLLRKFGERTLEKEKRMQTRSSRLNRPQGVWQCGTLENKNESLLDMKSRGISGVEPVSAGLMI